MLEDRENKFECLDWLKLLFSGDEFVLFNRPKIKNIINQAQKHVHLRDNHKDDLTQCFCVHALQ